MIAGYEGDGRPGRGPAARPSPRRSPTSAARPPARSRAGRGPQGRFRAPYLRDSMLDAGVLVETLETATFWSGVPALYAAVRTALETSLTESSGAPALVLCHVSHVYETGCSLYFTIAAAPGRTTRWRSGGRPSAPPARRSSPTGRRSPTTTPSAPTT